ncbi:hypothetical protein A2914_01175 [Candidatus Nomurabacteria bacterium RIFCSPLOWO2_01_FULL_41_21]|uniref:Prepilin peptidase n=2 Tax=Candidatus Nomuraibacteriota TaxID=1752729 RepID=A0A1F6V2J4_9BACT|nr:MAG: hypothetical protein A2733_02265 [Candidatus Nomurabacteria bacterium RIFCSPHIGHO2_01_FULL_40_20]OGI87923.1 MAG: hypothetical protein A2914_01175 [Candidatus Nomurabacteria bacterium RIFCSPLOWO2_01_FULL_41_21]
MITILTIIFFILGLIIGSFLNVVILRLGTHKNFGGRSACMSCQTKLCWYEMIPVCSFFALGGRCRNCQSRISWQYPLVELATGVIFALLFYKFSFILFVDVMFFAIPYAFYTSLFSLLLVITVYDLRHKIIPDALSFIFGALAFLSLFLFVDHFFFYPHLPEMADVLSGLLVALPFALIWLLSRGRWMGLGDAKLAIGLGWLLGFSQVFSGVVIAFWAGGIVGMFILVFSKKYGWKSEIPFAPFLALGAFLAFLFNIQFFLF